MKHIITLIFAALIGAASAAVVTVTDKNGRSLTAQLISVSETHAKVKRVTDEKVFELPLASLNEASVKLLKEKAADLPKVYPELDVKISIGKRRVQKDDSYYMKTQTITTGVTLKNKDFEEDFPKSSARVVYIGQDKRNPDQYKVLFTNDFDVAPAASKTAEATLPEFTTSYDSDNEGYGNIGGFQYEGYIFIIWDSEKKVILHKTTNAMISKALESDNSTLGRMIKIRKDTLLDEHLAVPGSQKKKKREIVIE